MVAAKVIIDASNVLTLVFYNAIGGSGAGSSMSTYLADGMALQRTRALPPQTDPKTDGGLNMQTTIFINLASAFLYITTASTFFSGTLIFFTRYLVFIFVLIFAPLAFLGMAWPKLGKISTKWWDALFSQALVAPAYLFLIYVVIKIIGSIT